MLNREEDVEYDVNYNDAFKNFGNGDIVNGKVIDIRDKDVFIDIGYKSEGVINIKEFQDKDGNININIGDEVEALFFNKIDEYGFQILSKVAADRIKGWNKILDAYKNDEVVQGKVKNLVNGGFTVDIDNFLAFLPGSQVALHPIRNYSSYIGKTFLFKVININETKRNAVISRKVLLEEEKKRKKEELMQKLTTDSVLEGKVKNITDYGVFVDLGGIDGLVHITDMSWSRIGHPSDMVKIGDIIKVKVTKVEEDAGKKLKVYLGMKQLSEDPWKHINETFKENDIVKGKIVNTVDYGLFVEIAPGIEGLVHKSEITYDNIITDALRSYKVGDEIDVKIINIDFDNRRMSLSIKQCKPDPWEDISKKYQKGDIVEGSVTGIKDFGIFVKLEEGVEGLVHERDISWDKDDKPNFAVGDTIKSIVLNIDKYNHRIALGLKQLSEDPWEKIYEKYSVNDEVKAKVVSVKNFGAFVKLAKGIESLVPKSRFNMHLPKVDSDVEIRILKIDKEKKRLVSEFV